MFNGGAENAGVEFAGEHCVCKISIAVRFNVDHYSIVYSPVVYSVVIDSVNIGSIQWRGHNNCAGAHGRALLFATNDQYICFWRPALM